MLKKILIAIGILVVILGLLFGAAAYYLKADEYKVLNFIKENPQRTSLLLVRNDSILINHNSDVLTPLASTVKIIIAVEYAYQSANGNISADDLVALSDLEQFYVKNTDGDAHPEWLKSVEDKIVDNSISIKEIAKGMIKYSSNANTEWLQAKLGLDNINARIDSLGIENHTAIYYLVSSLFIGKELFPEMKEKELKDKLKQVDEATYIATCEKIHQKLLYDKNYKNNIGELGLDVQKIWTDRLPKSTVAEYVKIMKMMNDKNYFDAATQEYLDEVMEYLHENPKNKSWMKHGGMKGGSTAFLLTKALYTTDLEENTTEMVYFMNDLGILEMLKLQFSMNEFELKILTKDDFRGEVVNKF